MNGLVELKKTDLSELMREADDEFDAVHQYAHEDQFDRELEDAAKINMIRKQMKRQKRALHNQEK